MKRLIVSLTILALFAASCGNSDNEPAVTEAPTTTAADTTEAPTTEAGSEDPPAGDVIEVVLDEWSVSAPAEIDSGSVSIDVVNAGEFSHELAVVRGDSYDTLPQLDNGAVDEDALGADLIGRTEIFDGGTTISATFDLDPGSYVFICNIALGPNSHAAAGQVLSVTVN